MPRYLTLLHYWIDLPLSFKQLTEGLSPPKKSSWLFAGLKEMSHSWPQAEHNIISNHFCKPQYVSDNTVISSAHTREPMSKSCRWIWKPSSSKVNTTIQDVNSAFSPNQFVFYFGSTATRSKCRRRRRPAYTATLPPPRVQIVLRVTKGDVGNVSWSASVATPGTVRVWSRVDAFYRRMRCPAIVRRRAAPSATSCSGASFARYTAV